MIILLLIHSRSLATRAQSIAIANKDTLSSFSSCNDIDNCRTRWDIIWSCLTTIFLCTWVAIHPNIPEPVDTKSMDILQRCAQKITYIIRDKLLLFLCAVLLPEYILVWALRQRLVVSRIISDNAELQLSTAHAFFMIMGGFHAFELSRDRRSSQETRDLHQRGASSANATSTLPIEVEAKPVHPLTHEDVISMIGNSELTLPLEDEILDRGKSDWLAKTIILTQTLWFVAQCIARGIQHLPTTELEIVTLAYISINFGISIAWWNKPRNVDCPIRVFQWPEEQDRERGLGRWWEGVWENVFFSFTLGVQDNSINLHNRRKVPIFYSGKPTYIEVILSELIMLAVGIIFGAVHCIAWSFEYSSSTQVLLWRISSAAITFVPLLFFISVVLMILTGDLNSLAHGGYFAGMSWGSLNAPIMLLSLIMYIACRFATLVIAFLNLVSPLPGTLQAIYWTTLIPHV